MDYRGPEIVAARHGGQIFLYTDRKLVFSLPRFPCQLEHKHPQPCHDLNLVLILKYSHLPVQTDRDDTLETTEHYLPIYGLYADYENTVEIQLSNGQCQGFIMI